jgi:hypothetical protein
MPSEIFGADVTDTPVQGETLEVPLNDMMITMSPGVRQHIEPEQEAAVDAFIVAANSNFTATDGPAEI